MSTTGSKTYGARDLSADLLAGVVVFLVALPLCLGIALASDAPLFSGIVAGIVGGIVVGLLSGSQTSVAGPAAGLTAIVAAQIAAIGTFEGFLAAVVLAGAIQLAMGIARGGFIAAFFPSSVIKGLLAAIGVILILKQIPHVVGHDSDSIADMTYAQADGDTTLSALITALFDVHLGASIVGLGSILFLVIWNRVAVLKNSPVPAPLVVVVVGIFVARFFEGLGAPFAIGTAHLVQVPVAESPLDVVSFLRFPEWSVLSEPVVYRAAITIAIVATLETLLNLEAVDKIDPQNRQSPPNRELVAQGAGNMVSGLIGGLPMTSVIVRSSVNIAARNKTKVSAIFHGLLLVVSVMFAASLLNSIPLASLAAILLMTGLKLASPDLFKTMWRGGRLTFLPFIVTVVAIVLTDLLTGILIGLGVSLTFILYSNFRRPLRPVVERRPAGEVLRIKLANQVSFLNRAALANAFYSVEKGGHILFDARNTEFIDPDIVDLLGDFRDAEGPARGVQVSFLGFKEYYERLPDEIRFVEHATESVQRHHAPDEVLRMLADGNERYRQGRDIRELAHHVDAAADGNFPLAVVVSCSDARVPVETVFDTGVGDIWSERISGGLPSAEVLGGVEHACTVAGAKLVVAMAHAPCATVAALRDDVATEGCEHLAHVLEEIKRGVAEGGEAAATPEDGPDAERALAKSLARYAARRIRAEASGVGAMVERGEAMVVGAVYDASEGTVSFFDEDGRPIEPR